MCEQTLPSIFAVHNFYVQDEGKECRGYSKEGIGYEPEAIENLDCQGYPSEPPTSHTRWFWIKEKTNGETENCQTLRNNMAGSRKFEHHPL